MSTKKGNRVGSIRPEGDITGQKVVDFHRQVFKRVTRESKEFTIDLARTDSLDAAGISVLVAAHNSCKAVGGGLHLKGVGTQLMGTLRALGLDKHLDLDAAGRRAE